MECGKGVVWQGEGLVCWLPPPPSRSGRLGVWEQDTGFGDMWGGGAQESLGFFQLKEEGARVFPCVCGG